MRQIYEYHPIIGFRFIPGIKARLPHEGGGYTIRTNEAGFRCDRPFVAAKPTGSRRVLVFGDSFTAGDGVSNGHRYGDWCERDLAGLEVFNFGLPATGLDQHYLIYREHAGAIEHDLLVIAVFVENIRRVGSRFRHFHDESGRRVLYAKPYFTLDGAGLRLNGVPPPRMPIDENQLSAEDAAHIFTRERFPRLKAVYRRLQSDPHFERYVVSSGIKDHVLRLMRYQPIKEYDRPDHPAWQVMSALLGQWISGHRGPVVVMPIPLRHYVDGLASPAAYQERLRGATEAAGGRFFDPLPGLAALPVENRRALYFPHDGHLTRAGHEALGHLLAIYLAQQPELATQ